MEIGGWRELIIRCDDWERQGLKLSEGDQRGVEGRWNAVSLLGWRVGCDGDVMTCLWYARADYAGIIIGIIWWLKIWNIIWHASGGRSIST